MKPKFSETSAVRTDLAGRIEAALDNYLEAIARGYGAYLAPALEEGEPEIDVRHQLVLLARRVRHHRGRVESLDRGVLEQIQGDEKVRAELEHSAGAVDAKMRLVRSAYRGFYGRDNLARVGLAGDFPRGVVRLHQHAVTVKTSLESPELVLEPLLDLGLDDPERASVAARLARQLDPELTRLGELLDERHQASIRTLDARLQRQEVIREFDHHIRGVVRLAQGMFRLAGRNDLALRIRPILRRVLRKLDDQEAAEQAEGDQAQDEQAEAQAAPEGGEAGADEAAETAEAATSEETAA